MNYGKVRAAVLHSTGSTSRLSERASEVSAPILILHGTADSPADGGSPATAVFGVAAQFQVKHAAWENTAFPDTTRRAPRAS
jgi:hypothetical protein